MKTTLLALFVGLLMVGCEDEIPVPAFIACDACKKEVSSEGDNCPDCAHPISKSIDAYRKAYVPQPESKSLIVPDLDLELIWVEPGKFEMGSPYTEKDRDEDEIPHWVTLTTGFYLGKEEVTQAQWNRVMGDNPSQYDEVDRPVDNVTWTRANEFCEKITEIERTAGRLPLGMTFQLPTEAQWEFACRAGTKTPYSTGESISAKQENIDRTFGRSAPTGSYSANAWGFHDMHGNVQEWCADWYEDYETGSVKDPTGPDSGKEKVIRGGCWFEKLSDARSASRYDQAVDRGHAGNGFRISLRPKAEQEEPVAPNP